MTKNSAAMNEITRKSLWNLTNQLWILHLTWLMVLGMSPNFTDPSIEALVD